MRLPTPGRRTLLALALLALPAASCPDGTVDPPLDDEDDLPAQVVISPAADTLNWLTATRQLSAQVLNRAGGPVSASVSWSSQNSAVASVSNSGLVTAVAAGTATVVAQAGSVSGSATVVVRQLPATVTKRAGDGQSAPAGATLATSLEVEVKDQGGAPVPGAPLTWTVTSGGGTLSSASVTTDASGVGRATWRLGATVGAQAVQVASGSASAAGFTATATSATTVSITGVSPSILREGGTATVTGTGFSTTASQNTVTLDGLPATVTTASSTSLSFTVPTADCRPARQAELRVQVQGASATRSVGVAPDTALALTVGNGWFTNTNCIHLAAGTGSERYVVGVASTSETPSSLTPLQLDASAGTVLQGAPFLTPGLLDPRAVRLSQVGGVRAPWAPSGLRAPDGPTPMRRVHDAWEAQWRAEERRLVRRLGSPPELVAFRSRAAAAPAAVPAVGDTLPFSVPGSCSSGTSIKGVVRYVGRSGLWVEDVANPVQAFTAAEYKDLDDFYTDKTHAVLTSYFGDFVDLDNNQRTVVLLTKEVNKKENVLGFVWGGDLYPRNMCATSNQAEIFYGLVPDPNGAHGKVWTKSDVAKEYPTLVAHEITHVVQLTQIIHRSAADKATWELEGGATLAEQLVGYAALGHGPGQDLGSTVFWNAYDSGWYASWATDMAMYFGFAGDSRIPKAPEECSWMGLASEGNSGPCENSRAVYGVPSTLLRFTLDRYGAAKAGGEAALMRDLTSSSRTGMANLAGATGETSTRLLILFGITLWADGRVWNSLTSWNLYDVFQSFRETARLKPYTSTAAQPSLAASVRAGSNVYLEWTPASGHPPTSFRARTPAGGALPGHMVLWILRVQ